MADLPKKERDKRAREGDVGGEPAEKQVKFNARKEEQVSSNPDASKDSEAAASGVAGRSLSAAPVHPSVFFVKKNQDREASGLLRKSEPFDDEMHQFLEERYSVPEIIAKYRMATSVSGLGLWDWELATDKLYWNSNMFAIYEIDPADFDYSYASYEHVLHPDDKEYVNRAVAASIAQKKELHFQFRLKTKSGRVKYIDAHAKLVLDKNGEAEFLTGVNIDFTDKALRERAIVEEKERSKAVQDKLRMAEAHKATNSRFIGNLCHELRNPMVGISGSLFFAADETTAVQEKVKMCKKTVHLMLADNREKRPEASTSNRAQIAPLSMAVASGLPNTREREDSGTQEGSSRAGKDKLSKLLKSSSGSALYTSYLDIERLAPNHDLHTLAASSSAASDSDKVESKGMQEQRSSPPPAGDDAASQLLSYIDSLERHCSQLSKCLQDAQLAAKHQKAILDDTLTLSKIDARMIELNVGPVNPDHLVDSAMNMLNTFATAKGLELTSKGVRQADIVAVVKSLEDLPTIRQKLRLHPHLPREVVGFMSEKDQWDSERSGISSRVPSLRYSYEADKEGALCRRGQSLQLDNSSRVVLQTDSRHALQVLVNFISNGIKYTKEGSVHVDARLLPVSEDDLSHIKKAAGSRSCLLNQNYIASINCKLLITVKDTGSGISADKLSSLFHRFEEGKRSSTAFERASSGLSLAICSELCDTMLGTISAESEVNVGSSFSFSLPVVLSDIIEPLDDPPAVLRRGDECSQSLYVFRTMVDHRGENEGESVSGMGSDNGDGVSRSDDGAVVMDPVQGALKTEIKEVNLSEVSEGKSRADVDRLGHAAACQRDKSGQVLVVEDDKLNSAILRKYLRQMKVKSVPAFDGEEAVRIFNEKQGEFDLVFMDIRMPKMDGLEATRSIRSLEEEGDQHGRIPIVALSGNSEEKDRRDAMTAGMDGYLTKPYNLADLKATINFYLS